MYYIYIYSERERDQQGDCPQRSYSAVEIILIIILFYLVVQMVEAVVDYSIIYGTDGGGGGGCGGGGWPRLLVHPISWRSTASAVDLPHQLLRLLVHPFSWRGY